MGWRRPSGLRGAWPYGCGLFHRTPFAKRTRALEMWLAVRLWVTAAIVGGGASCWHGRLLNCGMVLCGDSHMLEVPFFQIIRPSLRLNLALDVRPQFGCVQHRCIRYFDLDRRGLHTLIPPL